MHTAIGRIHRAATRVAGAALIVSLACSSTSAQPGRDDRRPTIRITVPQFVVHAISFDVLDQTDWEWGSDEVQAVFVDFNPVRETVSANFGDVDAGESRSFGDVGACIAPLPACSNGASRLHFAVALWERDFSPSAAITGCYPTVLGRHPLYDSGICPGDDLIGRFELSFSQLELLGMMPTVGSIVQRKAKAAGGDGDYRVSYRITRLPDVRKTVVVGTDRQPR